MDHVYVVMARQYTKDTKVLVDSWVAIVCSTEDKAKKYKNIFEADFAKADYQHITITYSITKELAQ